MKKILVSFLLIHCFVILAEETKDFGLFEKYYRRKPLLSRLTGSDKGTQYIGVLSEDENSRLSMHEYLKYLFMIKLCKENKLARLSKVGTTYVCATDMSEVVAEINSMKKAHLEDMKSIGENLKKGTICFFPTVDGSGAFEAVAFYNLNNSDVNSVALAFKVLNIIKRSEQGVHVIDGYLVKIVTAQCGCTIDVSEILPTKEEIEKAKSIISE